MSLIGAVIKRRIPLPWKLLSEARSVDAGGTVGKAGTRVGVAVRVLVRSYWRILDLKIPERFPSSVLLLP